MWCKTGLIHATPILLVWNFAHFFRDSLPILRSLGIFAHLGTPRAVEKGPTCCPSAQCLLNIFCCAKIPFLGSHWAIWYSFRRISRAPADIRVRYSQLTRLGGYLSFGDAGVAEWSRGWLWCGWMLLLVLRSLCSCHAIFPASPAPRRGRNRGLVSLTGVA